MIITIDDNYADYINSQEFYCKHEDTMDLINLLLSRKRGFNFVVASRDTLKAIGAKFNLPDEFNAILNKIYSEQTFICNALKRMRVRINITSPTGLLGLMHKNDITSLNVTLHDFNHRELDKQANFIAENMYDIDIYTAFIKSYLKNKEIKNVSLQFKKIIGGGSTTNLVITEQKKNHNGFNLCILDSDKFSPTSSFGDTYLNACTASSMADNLVLIPTKSRELENIIPLSTLDTLFTTKSNKNKLIKYKQLIGLNLCGEPVLNYLDFKKGVRKLSCKKALGSEKLIFEKNLSELICPKPCRKKDEGENKDGKKAECSCIVLDGFGSDLLKCYTKHIEENPLDFNKIDDHCKDEWEYICDNALPILIAPLPIRA